MINIVVAVGKNFEIGKNNKMLWHIKEELRLFREITINKTVLMGRKTFESLNFKPLDNRKNIVITRNKEKYIKYDCIVCDNLDDILNYYLSTNEDIYIIGGESIYRKFLPYADKIYISYIDKNYEADTYFPKFDLTKYNMVSEKKYDNFLFRIYERKNMKKNIYITTPIYYPNAKPHVGTAYTTIIADVLYRYNKLNSNNVKFVTGTDEHGQKIQESAEKNNVTPQEWVDRMSKDFYNLWENLNIRYTDFVRTTNAEHETTVKDVLKKSFENGDIYISEYVGKYCVSEETFVTDSQLVDGKYMGKEVIEVKEPSYFFRLSKYQDKILDLIENNDFIIPRNRKNEIISFVKQGLQDLSISRTTFTWGIPMEFEEGHIVYVWFDALSSYLTGAGKSKNIDEFNMFWNNADSIVHIVGKDILRFHSVIWPAILMSAGYRLPNKVLTHGWWTVEGEKMSKSLGNVVDPLEEIKLYGVDAFRYFLMRESNFEKDADYSKKTMIQRINSDLANDLGNLLNRTISMINKYLGGTINISEVSNNEIDNSLNSLYFEVLNEIKDSYDNFELNEVLKSIWKYIARLNKYIDENEIWNLAKDESKKERLSYTLYKLVDGLYKVSYLIYPFMPTTANNILSQIGIDENLDNIENSELLNKENAYPFNNTVIQKPNILFPRIEIKESEFETNLSIQNEISIDDFNKVEIKVVEIEKVYKVENTNFLRVIINTGKEKRQVISNIGKTYSDIEQLKGLKVLAVLNLGVKEISGFLSQAMLLTTNEKKKTKLITVSQEIKSGIVIK